MSSKAEKIAAKVAGLDGGGLDPHYAGYFACFNRGEFYDAHDVLEQLWLPQRGGPNDRFYKGLIQLAGAFVHLQKNRLRPAGALLNLARANLMVYPPEYEHLDVSQVLALIGLWLAKLEAAAGNPLTEETRPKLSLLNSPRQS
jgi:predicted metal-dependent hydrolase